jgi:hypothetical protein
VAEVAGQHAVHAHDSCIALHHCRNYVQLIPNAARIAYRVAIVTALMQSAAFPPQNIKRKSSV